MRPRSIGIALAGTLCAGPARAHSFQGEGGFYDVMIEGMLAVLAYPQALLPLIGRERLDDLFVQVSRHRRDRVPSQGIDVLLPRRNKLTPLRLCHLLASQMRPKFLSRVRRAELLHRRRHRLMRAQDLAV